MNRAGKTKRRRLFLLKGVLYILCAFFLLCAEDVWYTLGIRTPALCAALCMALGMLEGARTGAVFGMVYGLVYDAAGGSTLFFSPILFLLYGFLAGAVTDRFWKRRFSVYAGMLAAASLLHAAVILCASVLSARAFVPILPALDALWRNALCTFLWALPLWFLLRPISRITDRTETVRLGKRKRYSL